MIHKTHYTEKWKSDIHLIYDFLDQKKLHLAKEYLKSIRIVNPRQTNTLGKVNKRHLLNNSQKNFLKKIEKKYEPIMKKFLEKIEPNKTHIKTKLNCSLAVLPANSKYPAHCDGLNKVLSGVVYIGENKNFGTFILNSKNDPKPLEVEWSDNKIRINMKGEIVSKRSYLNLDDDY